VGPRIWKAAAFRRGEGVTKIEFPEGGVLSRGRVGPTSGLRGREEGLGFSMKEICGGSTINLYESKNDRGQALVEKG